MAQLATEYLPRDDLLSISEKILLSPSVRPKNEWQELIQRQTQIAKLYEEKEKETKYQRSKYMSEELNKLIIEKEATKLKLLKEQSLEAERSKNLQVKYEAELQRKRQLKLNSQRDLALQNQLQNKTATEEQLKKREEERQIELNIVRDSLDSLQREKMQKKRKQEELKKSVFDIVLENEMQKKKEREISKLPEYGVEELAKAEKAVERARNENYKQWSDKRQRLDLLHEEHVGKDKNDRARKIEEFIQKGIHDQQLKWEHDQQMKTLNSQQNRNQLLSVLQQQINQKEQAKREQKLIYPQEAERIVKENTDYQNYLNVIQEKKIEKQRLYKEMLDQQKEVEEKKRDVDRVVEKDKKLNQQSLQIPEIKLDPLVLSVSRNKLDYLVSPLNSRNKKPVELSNPIIGVPNHLVSPKNNQPNNNLYSTREANRDQQQIKSPSFNQNAANHSAVANPNTNNSTRRQDNNISANSYNPITNPIPNYNQNPYIRARANFKPIKNVLAMAADNNLIN